MERIKLRKPERQDYLLKATFSFEGTVKVYAHTEEEAKEIVQKCLGMRCGEVHSSDCSILNWDIDMTPTKRIRRCVK